MIPKELHVKFGLDRVMGYLRPAYVGSQAWYNKGKISEFKERKYFDQHKAMDKINTEMAAE